MQDPPPEVQDGRSGWPGITGIGWMARKSNPAFRSRLLHLFSGAAMQGGIRC